MNGKERERKRKKKRERKEKKYEVFKGRRIKNGVIR